ncbi:alpha-galactosidase [Leifsonia naganoensis]|uniref:alpha-galactosidase n=1 Tax=Leifsonia naganoensis TaxID=150025 RepID=A0A853DPC8_9MICO|nr:alpha-galactosidase [Leifsonia naganoensis]NYK09369.1 alpha-galactosidase [Leifsonia naganoensis]
MLDGSGAVLLLRAAGASLVIDAAGPVPRVLHWGADLGPLDPVAADALRVTGAPAVLNNAPDVPRAFSLWATEYEGWAGTPAQEGHAAGSATTPRPRAVAVRHRVDGVDGDGGGLIEIDLVDEITGLRSTMALALDRFGVLAVDVSVVRDEALLDATATAAPYELDALRVLLPLPERAVDILDFNGKWCRERSPQRGAIFSGTHLRRTRRGKPGHDSPFLVVAGTSDLAFGTGEAWATHLAWSGDSEYVVERLPEGAGAFSSVLGAGEALRPGEILLAPGDRYDAPTALFVWSGDGLDGVADRLHRRLRARPSHPATPRPLTLNSWEAVYFDHDLDRLSALVERAARVGVERVVLDDGWFHGRRAANAGLGDWFVDRAVWPEGLAPLVDRVRSHGMQFGIWFEPEMINLDSDLARLHPDWVLGPRAGLGATARDQYVLDLTRTQAYDLVLDRISAIVEEYGVDYIKWDHNRDLSEAVSGRSGNDRPAVHEQTRALYRMLDALRERHPGLEIETCSGGGGRVDLGILDRTDRIWASDCNDPVERLQIERWTRMLVPPELIGSHLGAERSHTTSRRTDLSFRLIVSLTAHAGIEWDLQEADDVELETIARWGAVYRELRDLIHRGRVVNADLADEATVLTGIVAQDSSRAIHTWARLATSAAGQSGRVRFPGLDAAARYSVRIRDEFGTARRHQSSDPEWLAAALTAEGITLPGSVLGIVGVPLPTLAPQQAMLFDLVRVA